MESGAKIGLKMEALIQLLARLQALRWNNNTRELLADAARAAAPRPPARLRAQRVHPNPPHPPALPAVKQERTSEPPAGPTRPGGNPAAWAQHAPGAVSVEEMDPRARLLYELEGPHVMSSGQGPAARDTWRPQPPDADAGVLGGAAAAVATPTAMDIDEGGRLADASATQVSPAAAVPSEEAKPPADAGDVLASMAAPMAVDGAMPPADGGDVQASPVVPLGLDGANPPAHAQAPSVDALPNGLDEASTVHPAGGESMLMGFAEGPTPLCSSVNDAAGPVMMAATTAAAAENASVAAPLAEASCPSPPVDSLAGDVMASVQAPPPPSLGPVVVGVTAQLQVPPEPPLPPMAGGLMASVQAPPAPLLPDTAVEVITAPEAAPPVLPEAMANGVMASLQAPPPPPLEATSCGVAASPQAPPATPVEAMAGGLMASLQAPPPPSPEPVAGGSGSGSFAELLLGASGLVSPMLAAPTLDPAAQALHAWLDAPRADLESGAGEAGQNGAVKSGECTDLAGRTNLRGGDRHTHTHTHT